MIGWCSNCCYSSYWIICICANTNRLTSKVKYGIFAYHRSYSSSWYTSYWSISNDTKATGSTNCNMTDTIKIIILIVTIWSYTRYPNNITNIIINLRDCDLRREMSNCSSCSDTSNIHCITNTKSTTSVHDSNICNTTIMFVYSDFCSGRYTCGWSNTNCISSSDWNSKICRI